LVMSLKKPFAGPLEAPGGDALTCEYGNY
jgi:hypothetical protein